MAVSPYGLCGKPPDEHVGMVYTAAPVVPPVHQLKRAVALTLLSLIDDEHHVPRWGGLCSPDPRKRERHRREAPQR